MSEENRIIFGYEDKPPQCGNCRSMKVFSSNEKPSYFCNLGKFSVRPGAVCDKYMDRTTGARIEGGHAWRDSMARIALNLGVKE